MKLVKNYIRLFLILLAFSNVIQATTMKEASIEKMTKDADLIIVGRVESMDCRWVQNGRMIHTFVTISIENLIKGTLDSKSIIVEVPGGIVGEVAAMPMGEAKFYPKEEILLFLVKNKIIPSATYFVVGLCQGKFRINQKDINNKNILERDLEGITLIEKKGRFIPKYLDELINEVKKIIDLGVKS